MYCFIITTVTITITSMHGFNWDKFFPMEDGIAAKGEKNKKKSGAEKGD